MYLIQILLPLRDNQGQPYLADMFQSVNASLVEAFGGVTAYSRVPAKGTWVHHDHEERDDVIVLEVMAETLDRAWWEKFRLGLESQMRQKEIVVRSHPIDRL